MIPENSKWLMDLNLQFPLHHFSNIYKSLMKQNGFLILLATMEQSGKDKIIFTELKLIKEDLQMMSQCPQFVQNRTRLLIHTGTR